MNTLLLDTNILIYILRHDEKILSFIENFSETSFHISIVSWIEVLTGSNKHNKSIDELIPHLEGFIRLPLDISVSKLAAKLLQNSERRGMFQDGVIAATAITYNMPLVTNNPKDFRTFRKLKIITPK